jgi:hypothetical protein
LPVTPLEPRIATCAGRRIAVTVLLVLATILTTAFGFSLWAKRQALDTNNWVDTSSALLEDEEIRQAVGLFIIDRLYQSDEVAARIEQVLPPRLAQLAKPAAAGLKQIAQRNAGRGARHGRRTPGLGDGQPDSAPDAATHNRE